MARGLVTNATIDLKASPERVWEALTDPSQLTQYMFGSTVASDFRKGSPITFEGAWQGRPYKDKGEILEVSPNEALSYSHFSPLMGRPDRPEKYHTVTIRLSPAGAGTRVSRRALAHTRLATRAGEHAASRVAIGSRRAAAREQRQISVDDGYRPHGPGTRREGKRADVRDHRAGG